MTRALTPNIQTFGPESTNDDAPKRGLVGANGKKLNRMQCKIHVVVVEVIKPLLTFPTRSRLPRQGW